MLRTQDRILLIPFVFSLVVVGKKFHSIFSQQLLHCGTNSQEDDSPISTILTSSSLLSTVIYFTCHHNLYWLTPLAVMQKLHSFALSLEWILGFVLGEDVRKNSCPLPILFQALLYFCVLQVFLSILVISSTTYSFHIWSISSFLLWVFRLLVLCQLFMSSSFVLFCLIHNVHSFYFPMLFIKPFLFSLLVFCFNFEGLMFYNLHLSLLLFVFPFTSSQKFYVTHFVLLSRFP